MCKDRGRDAHFTEHPPGAVFAYSVTPPPPPVSARNGFRGGLPFVC